MASIPQRLFRKLRRHARQWAKPLCFPLRVGIVGLGNIAPDHLDGFEGSLRAQVVAVSDLQPAALAYTLESLPALAGYLDYRQMLDEVKPDIVSVCTWPQSHAEVIRAAAESDVKAILCEKPLALTLADVRSITTNCSERGVKLAGGHQYRFHPAFVRAAALLRAGSLGALRTVRGYIKNTLANNGPHLFDTVRFLLGDQPVLRIACHCQRVRDAFNRGYPAEDSAEGEVTFGGGVTFRFVTGEAAPEFFAVRVECERGHLDVTPKSLLVDGAPQNFPADPSAVCRREQFRQFVRWARGKQDRYPADGEASAISAELVLAAYEAARLGKAVALPLRNDGDVIRQLYPEEAPREAIRRPALDATSVAPLPPPAERLAIDGGPRALTRWFSTMPTMGLRELAAVARVIGSKHLIAVDGRTVHALEKEFAACYGVQSAVASTSGTAAIHVALGTLNPEACSEVITTPVTDMGSVIPILACNCIPVFADVDPMTGNLTPESIASKITPRTAAVILVHLFGRPADIRPISAMLRSRGIALIEDCSQAHYAQYQGRKVGTFGDFGCFSFQQSKQMTCGDGGMTLVNQPTLIDRAAMFVDKGWDRKHGTRSHLFLGMNYRMTELQAAVARVQLRRLPHLIRLRREMANRLSQKLSMIHALRLPQDGAGVVPSWWKYLCHVDEENLGVSADAFAAALRVEGVQVMREYVPRPAFEYDVLKKQRTYGESGYPFTAVNYREPVLEDFPGFLEFSRSMLLMSWSHHVRTMHVDSIAHAARKVARLLPLRVGRCRDKTTSALQKSGR